ncbi:MAG: hypothetical protein ACO1O4_16105 [Devosia sp.]
MKGGQNSLEEKAARALESQPFNIAVWAIFASNLALIAVEMTAGLVSGSAALKVDAMALLACVSHCLLALLAGRWTSSIRSRVRIVGVILTLGLGFSMLAITAGHLTSESVPHANTMGTVGVLAAASGFMALCLLHSIRGSHCRQIWTGAKRRAWIGGALTVAALIIIATSSAISDLGLAFVLSAAVIIASTMALPGAVGEFSQRHRHR